MKLSQRFTIGKKETPRYVYGVWNPTMADHRDMIEGYLYISRKRMAKI